jgi:hypothetical protein
MKIKYGFLGKEIAQFHVNILPDKRCYLVKFRTKTLIGTVSCTISMLTGSYHHAMMCHHLADEDRRRLANKESRAAD